MEHAKETKPTILNNIKLTTHDNYKDKVRRSPKKTIKLPKMHRAAVTTLLIYS